MPCISMHAELQVGVRPLRPRPSLSSSLRCTRRRPEAVQAQSLGICGAPDSQDREFDAILHTFGRQGLSGSFTAMKFSCPASLPGLRPPHARVASWPASHVAHRRCLGCPGWTDTRTERRSWLHSCSPTSGQLISDRLRAPLTTHARIQRFGLILNAFARASHRHEKAAGLVRGDRGQDRSLPFRYSFCISCKRYF